MIARRRGLVAGLTALVAAMTLASCTADPAPAPTSSQTAGATATPSGDAEQPSPSPTVDAELSCETLLPEATVADFHEIGWTAQENPFYAGAVEIADGIQCTWGDFSVATDHVQIFGWAPVDGAVSSTALEELVSSGWTREDSADGIYVTESPETAIATDEQGYGITYLFGDGWVTIADTKQGLLLIERPGA